MPKLIDETGNKYGVLTVIERAPQKKGQVTHWLCRCGVCGTQISVQGFNLRRRNYSECHHRNVEYTISDRKHPLFNLWEGMITRCERPHSVLYHNYGARGIKLCARWHVFANFVKDMGERPGGLSIDRIDNNGDYEPSNCRWATRAEQAKNRRNTRMITFNGVTLCMSDWAKKIGISKQGLWHRLSIGWPIEKALCKGVGSDHNLCMS